MKRLINYLKNVKSELKKVTWPSAKLTLQLTLLVLVVTIVWAAYIWGLDLGFSRLMELIVK